MSDLYASLNGARVVSCTATIPYWGLWSADVALAGSDEMPARCSLQIGNLTLSGAVYRQASFAGSRSVRLVGGAGGWRKAVQSRAYNNPNGLALSMVLRDAALEVGETVVVANDTTIGTAYVREAAAASRVLRHLVGKEWWADAAGVTRLGARPSAQVTSDFLVAARSGSRGQLTIATEDLASWLPGATFANALVPDTQTVASVSLRMELAGKLRLEVLAA